jgi:hypothetical protein
MYKRILTSALLFGMIATGPPASAAPCGVRDLMVERLLSHHKEQLTATGLQNERSVVEVWTSKDGSFTILITRADGISCMVSAGHHWTAVEPKPDPDGVAG